MLSAVCSRLKKKVESQDLKGEFYTELCTADNDKDPCNSRLRYRLDGLDQQIVVDSCIISYRSFELSRLD